MFSARQPNRTNGWMAWTINMQSLNLDFWRMLAQPAQRMPGKALCSRCQAGMEAWETMLSGWVLQAGRH